MRRERPTPHKKTGADDLMFQVILLLVGPILTIVAVCLAVWPTKDDAAYPARRVRDWWSIVGCMIGAVVAHRLAFALLGFGVGFVPGVGRAIQMSGVIGAGAGGMEKAMYITLVAVLLWQAWRETVELPRERAGDSPPYRIVWRDVVGLTLCAAILLVWAFGLPEPVRRMLGERRPDEETAKGEEPRDDREEEEEDPPPRWRA